MTTEEAYIDFLKNLKTIYDEREADHIADWVFEKVTGSKKLERKLNRNTKLEEICFVQIENYLKELMENKPVQYVLNEAWFYKRKFFVDENVLIPRPETEELVEWIIGDINAKTSSSKPTNIIDIGTGSGCIAVSLKKEISHSNISAIDVSGKTLRIAQKNAAEFNAIIDFIQIDFLNETEWNQLSKYNIIASNPPYIPLEEKKTLAKNVTEFEPAVALFVDNADPFIFYKKIAKFAKNHLIENGNIYVEVHEEFAEKVKKIFEKEAFKSEIKKDIYGKERMIKAF